MAAADTSNSRELERREEEKKKRPEVEHYKPGAFTSRRNGSEDARRASSLEGGNRGNSGGKSEVGKESNFEGNKGGNKGGNNSGGGTGKRGKKHDDPNRGGRGSEERGRRVEQNEDWRAGGSGRGKKKPDIEPYVPKKIQEHREGKVEDTSGKGDTGKKEGGISVEGNTEGGGGGGVNKEGGGGGGGTARKRNKKKKNKSGGGGNDGEGRGGGGVGRGGGGGEGRGGVGDGSGTIDRNKARQQKNDEHDKGEADTGKDTGRRNNKKADNRNKDQKTGNPEQQKNEVQQQQQQSTKGEQAKDLRETLDNKKTLKMSGSQSNPDFKSSAPKNDDINPRKISQDQSRKDKKGGNYDRYDAYDGRNRNNRHSYHENVERRDHFKIPENTKTNQRYNHNYDEYSNYRGRGGGGAQKEFRRGQSFGQEYDRRGESEPKENGYKNFDSRSGSPHNWNWRGRGRGGGGGGGNFSRGNSRASSPTRSQRGKNSRNSSPQSSRGNSRRNSPTSFDHSRTNSPVRHTRVFRRNTSPPRGSRSTMSRTPSPPHSVREGFGRGGGGGRGGSHTLGRQGQSKRDSRDLDGWSRQDNFDRSNPRRDDLWDPRGKPPSGRPKSAVVKSSLPPRFQRNRDGEEVRVDRESVGRDMLGELRDAFPPPNDARDGPMSSSWAGDRRRMDSSDSVHSKDVSGVSDWSVEVEEEDERRSQAGTLDRCNTPMSDRHTISPPSRALSPSSRATMSPRALSPDFTPQGGHAGGLIKLPDSMSNPHWRPPPDTRHPAWKRDDHDWRAGSQPQTQYPAPTQHWSAPSTPSSHYPPPIRGGSGGALYDPRNPAKPAPRDMISPDTQHYPNPRFPMEPSRFAAPSHMLPPHLPQGPGYRPPFPPRLFAAGTASSNRPSMVITPPDWYDVFNANIYGSGKTDINCIAHIVRADMKLRSVLQGGPAIVCSRWDQEVRETRHQIMAAARYLMKNDMMFVVEREVEIHIWKTVYYQVIEMLKAAYLDVENTMPENRKTLKNSLVNLFEEGVDYYTQLLIDLSTTYRVDLELYYDPLEPREGVDRMARLARISAQKCLLCLGDLARYREQVNSSTNYGRARQYYSKANHLEMRNGRPFNMLAILAKVNNRKFEAVYYHVRCLSSRNPFQSSKEGLVTIFEEMKRRWEVGEKKRVEERKEGEREREGRRIVRGSKVRKEIWERPGEDGGRRLHRTTSAQSGGEELATMSVADLNKRFINTFLYLQGKLFTQINTEDFPVAQASLLDQFRVLISKSPLPLSTDRLVQIMALNMYIIEETKLRADSTNPTYRSVCQDLALSLAGDMFGLLLERCNLLVARGDPSVVLQPTNQLQEDLCNLLAPVKVWCDWLLGNNDTWYPLVSAEPFAQLAQLATRLEGVNTQVSGILEECLSEKAFLAQPQARREEFALIKLAEDALLCEFTPWFRGHSWESYRQYCPRNLSVPRATAAKRVSQILLAVECLEGLDQPVLKWSLPDNSHVCLVTDSTTNRDHFSRDIAVSNLTAMIARDEYVLEESYSGEEEEEEGRERGEDEKGSDSETDTEIGRLRERKEELERARHKEQARARKAQSVILSEVVSVSLHIRPRLLVPDTNILVDSLESMKELANSGDWSIRVPTTVVIELEGLTKAGDGNRAESDSAEHLAQVRENSRGALAWLRDKPINTKCVTSKGTILANFGVISEEDCSDGQKNDDKILSCCLALNTGPPPTVTQGIKTVYRDTVLITDDRNLKLKAHTSDCAVNTIKEFMGWVNLKK